MLDLTEVLQSEGRTRHYETELALDQLCYRFGRFAILEKTPVSLDITNTRAHARAAGLMLSGSVRLKVAIPCARCLEPVPTVLDISLELSPDPDEKEERYMEEYIKEYIDGHNLKVEQLVHDEALLIWPERVLCREDCRGLCSSCGQNLNYGSCKCRPADLDPRMAKVLDIFSNYKEV